MAHPIQLLERYWGHSKFRPHQEEIIQAVLDNDDVFCLLPTGGGKSVCFQIPALIKEGICIVISPLIALMEDQVGALSAQGIKSMALTGGISYNQLDTLLDNCIYGNYKFLYLSPERLQQDIVQQRIAQMTVNLIAVDEAHCISQWGHDFRPAYNTINLLREIKPSVNIIALTATAKPEVIVDIIKGLDLLRPKIFKASFCRENIAYTVKFVEDKNYALIESLKSIDGSAIIYVRSRRNAEDYNNILNAKNYQSNYFHGGLDTSDKNVRLQKFLSGETKIMVATTAFGMGIDKADVRLVVHINLPESLESYYQESGRAGRDGKPAQSLILTNLNDEHLLWKQFIKSVPTIEDLRFVYKKINSYFRIAYGEGENSLHQFNFGDFCNAYSLHPSLTYNGLKVLDRSGILRLEQQFGYKTTLQFIVSNNILFNFLKSNKSTELVTRTILRTYGGIFEHSLNINISSVSKKAQVSEKEVLKVLHILADEGMVEFMNSAADAKIELIQPREDDLTINRIAKIVDQNLTVKKRQVQSVIEFIGNHKTCLNKFLLNYFGEDTKSNCGICSNCIKYKEVKTDRLKVLRNDIILLLKERPLSSRALKDKTSQPENVIIDELQRLLEHDIVEVTHANTYKIK